MNKTEYFDHLIPEILCLFEAQAFKFKKSEYSFIRKESYGWINVYFHHYTTSEATKADIGIEIRYDFVEEIVNKYSLVNPKGWKKTSTLMFSLADFAHYEDGVFSFFSLGELNNIIDVYFKPFIVKELPLIIERLKDLEFAYDIMTNPFNEYYSRIKHGYNTILRSLVIFRVLKKVDFFSYTEDLRSRVLSSKRGVISSFEIEQYHMYFDKLVMDLNDEEWLRKVVDIK